MSVPLPGPLDHQYFSNFGILKGGKIESVRYKYRQFVGPSAKIVFENSRSVCPNQKYQLVMKWSLF